MVIVSDSKSSANLRGLPMLFADRAIYGVNRIQVPESATLLKLIISFLEDKPDSVVKFNRRLLVLLRNLNALVKYQTEDLKVFNSLVLHPLVKFNIPHFVAGYRYILGEQKTIASNYVNSIGTIQLSVEGSAILRMALQEIMINESLALGVCLNEEELFLENSEEEVVTQPVEENFHFNGSHLYYAGISVSNAGLPQPEGARQCLIDSIRIGIPTEDQIPLTFCSFGTTLGGTPTSSSAFVVGNLINEVDAPNGTPDKARSSNEFLLTPRVSGEGTKILVLFSGNAKANLLECVHEVIRTDLKILEIEGSTFSIVNKFKKRWLADNLLEITCRSDCKIITNSIGIPVVDSATAGTTQMVQAGVITAGSTIDGSNPSTPMNLSPGNIRLTKVPYIYGPLVYPNSKIQIPMNAIPEVDSYPIRFTALPRFWPYGANNSPNNFRPGYIIGGALASTATAKINSRGEQIGGRIPIKLRFNSMETILYVGIFSGMLEQSTEM